PYSCISILFFYSSGDYRYLHSFPTRRSSDLANFPSGFTKNVAGSMMNNFLRDCGPVPVELDGEGRFVQPRKFFVPAYEKLTWLKDRKSTRLNSSHVAISYAVFCLKKKKNINL